MDKLTKLCEINELKTLMTQIDYELSYDLDQSARATLLQLEKRIKELKQNW